MSFKKPFQRFRVKRSIMLRGGGKIKIDTQHSKGKLTARERINLLLDEGSFIEHQPYVRTRCSNFGMSKKRFSGDGVITGTGKINGRQVFIISQDFTILGGSLGEMHAEKIAEVQMLALKNGVPFIQINDSGGARIQEGILSLNGYGKIFRLNTVIKAVTGEVINHQGLGGAAVHNTRSGNAHFCFSTELECIDFLKKLLGYLPSNNTQMPPISRCEDTLDRETPLLKEILPDNPKETYDIRDFINEIFDRGSFIEIHRDFSPIIVVGFARLGGRTVGVFANQPMHFAGAIDIDSSDKGARFLRFCDSFNIPIISMVDTPGFLPGVAQEHGGIIRHGAKILYAIAEATVPKISLIIRKAYGGAYIAMASKSLGYDRVLAFPCAEIAVMGAEGAVNIIFRNDIQSAPDIEEMRTKKIEEFRKNIMNPYISADYGLVDDIIDPKYSRIELIRSLEMNIRKKEDRPTKKHGNIPL